MNKYSYIKALHDTSYKALEEMKANGYRPIRKIPWPNEVLEEVTQHVSEIPQNFKYSRQLLQLMKMPEFEQYGQLGPGGKGIRYVHPEYLIIFEHRKTTNLTNFVMADMLLFPRPQRTKDVIPPVAYQPAIRLPVNFRSTFLKTVSVPDTPVTPYWISIYNVRDRTTEKKYFNSAAEQQQYIKSNAGHLSRRSGNEFLDTSKINGMHWLDQMDRERVIGKVKPGISETVRKQIEAAAKVKKAGGGKMAQELAMMDPEYTRIYLETNKIIAAMKRQGIANDVLAWVVYQTAHETNNYKSDLYLKHHNASGIKFAGQKGAVKGTNGYAWFPGGLNDWATSMKYEITKGSNPAGAKSMQEYVQRLKQNGYFQDTLENYYNGLARAEGVIKKKPAAYVKALADQKEFAAKFKQDLQDIDKDTSWFKKHPIWTGVIAAVGGIVVIKAVTS